MLHEIIPPLALLLAAYLLMRDFRLRRKTREIEGFIRELAGGNLKKRLFPKKGERFSEIVLGLNRIAESFEEKIREANEQSARLASTLNNLPDGIVLLDCNGTVRFVNPAFESLFNVKSAQLMDRGLNEVLRIPELAESLVTPDAGSPSREAYIETIDRHVSIKTIPFLDADMTHSGGRHNGTMVIFRDITESKRTDETRRDFVANVSHELKTPITAIRGYTETLLDGAVADREDAVRFLKTIKAHTERMDSLIRDLIKLSQIELGAMPVEKRPLRIEPLVDEVFKGFESLCRRKGITLRKEIHGRCAVITADPLRLTQILSNLVDNAVKFTDSGRVTVRAAEESGRCTISVEDTGAGIPKRFLPRLGERFFRVDPSRSRELGGTGLGLAIVKHLVKAHGWEMRVESEEGRGTSIRLLLPRTDPAGMRPDRG